jgi:peroxiredoxin
MSLAAPRLETPAPDFALPGIDGKTWTLAQAAGPKGVLVMFICNHCPYVKAAIGRIVRDAAELAYEGIGAIAVMPNDTEAYPADSFANMRAFARQHALPFPYVIDESQGVARAYGAVCTPEFFGYNAAGELQYHGRIDAGGYRETPGAKRELFDAMVQIARSGRGPAAQSPAMGCSIKWKNA